VDRKRQDFLTWLLGVGLLLSQLLPFVPRRAELVVAASGLLGLPTIRKVQDAVSGTEKEDSSA
jgi:hypothetical protein